MPLHSPVGRWECVGSDELTSNAELEADRVDVNLESIKEVRSDVYTKDTARRVGEVF
jgi:hypothetical protein